MTVALASVFALASTITLAGTARHKPKAFASSKILRIAASGSALGRGSMNII